MVKVVAVLATMFWSLSVTVELMSLLSPLYIYSMLVSSTRSSRILTFDAFVDRIYPSKSSFFRSVPSVASKGGFPGWKA